ncbi:hypothetical protein BJF80_00970 [Serinicoccus sp. CUA-874]|nr:cell wall-binding repeat-containing protein [Serinicoccus sp. CUA-874]OLT17918.1 hypothetical protein BJF80_00970 [Serinicoccus sp. CUA-874]
MRRIRQVGTAGVVLAVLGALGLGTVSVASPQEPDVDETQAATRTAVDWSGLGPAPCPEGMTRRVSVDSHSMDRGVPQSRFNNGWSLVSSRDGSAARASVSSGDTSDHMFLPYVKVSVDRRTMLGFSTRSTQGNSGYTRAQMNSVDLRVYAGRSWGGRVYDVTAATDDENGHLGAWFEHRSRSGASTWWDVDNVQIYTCRDAPVSRIAGSDRYDSAARVAATYPAGVRTAYLATGENFPDAIGASALAGQLDAPVLLTRSDHLPSRRRPSCGASRRIGWSSSVAPGRSAARSRGRPAPTPTPRPASPAGPATTCPPGWRAATRPAARSSTSPAGPTSPTRSPSGHSPATRVRRCCSPRGRAPPVRGGADRPARPRSHRRRRGPRRGLRHRRQPAAPAYLRLRVADHRREPVCRGLADRPGVRPRPARAYVATGTAFPDALVGAARAGSQGVPVVLTRQGQLVSDGRAALQALDPLRGVLLGGQVALSSVVMDQVGAHVG